MNPASDIRFLYLAPWGWRFLRNRSQPLAEALARFGPVHYVDPTLKCIGPAPLHGVIDRVPILRRAADRAVIGIRPSAGVPGIVWHKALGLAGGGADRVPVVTGARSWLEAIARPLFARGSRPVLLTSQPRSAWLAGAFPWWRVVVDLQDPWFEVYTPDEAPRDETLALLARADLVTANGDAIARDYAAFAPGGVRALPNGLDPIFVEQAAGPPPPGRPRLVYAGNLNPRTDTDLMEAVIREATDWDFVFAGRVQLMPAAAAAWARVCARPNVTVLGSLPHAEMPALYASARALWLPYAHAGSAAMFPQKLLEYAAAGRPIVSTLPFRLEGPAAGALHVAADAAGTRAVLRRLAEADGRADLAPPDAVRDWARGHLWERRAGQLADWLGIGR